MGKNVALAVVSNSKGVLVLDANSLAGEGVNASMVRDFINKDLTRYPDLRGKVAAIEEIVIRTDETISSANYAQEMAQCYIKHMRAGYWEAPDGLHIFETFLGSVTVYIAYGI